uniref:Uncharacterized protein n=1 Tax=Anguilla anguilla TaxID=7936 RepID=A0A0E9XRA7_ANGAN
MTPRPRVLVHKGILGIVVPFHRTVYGV